MEKCLLRFQRRRHFLLPLYKSFITFILWKAAMNGITISPRHSLRLQQRHRH